MELPSLRNLELTFDLMAPYSLSLSDILFDKRILRQLVRLTIHGKLPSMKEYDGETFAELCPSLDTLNLHVCQGFISLLHRLPPGIASLSLDSGELATENFKLPHPLPPTLTSLHCSEKLFQLQYSDVLGAPDRAALAYLSKEQPQLVHLHLSTKSPCLILPADTKSGFPFPNLESFVFDYQPSTTAEIQLPTRWIDAPKLRTASFRLQMCTATWLPLPPLTHLTIRSSDFFLKKGVELSAELLSELPRSLTSLHLLGQVSLSPSDARQEWVPFLPSGLKELAIPPYLVRERLKLPIALERLNVTYHSEFKGYSSPQSLCAWNTMKPELYNGYVPPQTLPFHDAPSIKELYTALPLDPLKIDSLPHLVVLSMPASKWSDLCILELLEARPSIRQLTLITPLPLPLPPKELYQDNHHFDLDLYQTVVDKKLFAQHQGRSLTIARQMPESFEFPNSIKSILINHPIGDRTQQERIQIFRPFKAPPHLTSLHYLEWLASDHVSLNMNYLLPFPSLEELVIPHIHVEPFDFALLPRTLRIASLLLKAPPQQSAASHQFSTKGTQTLGMGPAPHPFVGNAKGLPPLLEELSLAGMAFTSESILKWPKKLRKLTIESDGFWTDSDLLRLHLRLIELQELHISGIITMSDGGIEAALQRCAAKAHDPTTPTSISYELLIPSFGLKDAVELCFPASSLSNLPSSITALNLIHLRISLPSVPSKLPLDLTLLSLPLGSFDVEFTQSPLTELSGSKGVGLLHLPPRLTALSLEVRRPPKDLNQLELLPRSLKFLKILAAFPAQRINFSASMLSALPPGIEALILPYACIDPITMPPNLQQICFQGGDLWTDVALSVQAKRCALAYSASQSSVFTDPSLQWFRLGPEMPTIKASRYGSQLPAPSPSELVFVQCSLTKLTGELLEASPEPKGPQEKWKLTAQILISNGAHVLAWL